MLVARTPERVTLFRRIASAARAQGVACEMISIAEAAEKYPVMRTDDLLGALWLPVDGKVNPADVTQALARGARMNGARIFEQTRVTAIHQKDGVVTGVATVARRHQGRGRHQLRRPMGESRSAACAA